MEQGSGRSARDLARGLAYLSPNLFGFLLFTALPVVAVFVVAFTEGSYTSSLDPATGAARLDARWVGLENFARLASDGDLWRSLWNTVVLMAAIPLQMALALGLAMLLDRPGTSRVVLRTMLFLPTVAAGIALYLVWRQIYNQDSGLLNASLAAVGVVSEGGGPDWLGSTTLAKPALLLMLVWIAMGGTNMILYLAGLQDIDRSLYEAAAIDGAGPWDTFWSVTWPALRPTTFFIFTTNLIGGFQIFDQVLIMTRGGPEGSTSTILYEIYRNIYEYQGKMGYAAAQSVLLFGLVLLVTLGTWWLGRKGREA
ncbi:MAG: sugar ABC transporter permease [Planctomycetes bacterium]|nr:sugar ABC transporter permease [Planctomycetota bacterium]